VFGFFGKKKARDLAEEIKSADHSDKVREFPLGFTIALWAVKLFLWLLSKHPNLIHVALDKFVEFAGKELAHERQATLAAVELLRCRVIDSPVTFAKVAEKQ
jgi:hypothetical protein